METLFEHYLLENEYRLDHTAPRPDEEGGNSLHDLSMIYGDDIYSDKGIQYYGDRIPADRESHRVIMSAQNNPDKIVTMYRAVPKGVTEIHEGDWVTISKIYANDHGYRHIGDDYEVLSMEVRADELYTDGNSMHEWGYWPK